MPANLYYVPLRNTRRPTAPAPGGLCHIYFAAVEDVLFIPLPALDTGIISDDILLKDGKAWYVLQSQPKRGFKEEQKASDAGSFFDVSVSAALPFDTAYNHLTLDRLKYHRYIVLVMRPDKSVRLVGSVDNPARLSFTTDDGEKQGDAAATAILFSCSMEDLPPLYEGVIAPIAP